MSEDSTIREGRTCLSAALLTAAIGFVLFGGTTLAMLLVPDEVTTIHYVIACLTGLMALLMFPWQYLDAKTRKHALLSNSVTYRCGVLSRFEVEVPYRSIQAVTLRQGMLQRALGCADVRVSAHGVSGPLKISQADLNSVCLRSIPDYAEVVRVLREMMNEYQQRD